MIFFDKIVGAASKVGFWAAKNSPEILLGVGVVSVVVGTAIACAKTLSVSPILEEYQKNKDDIDTLRKTSDDPNEEGYAYSKEQERHDRFVNTAETIGKLTIHYAVPAALLAGGIAAIVASHNIMAARYATLCSAYTALASSIPTEEHKEGGDKIKINDAPLVDYRGRALEHPFQAWLGSDNMYNPKYPEAAIFDLERIQKMAQKKLDIEGHLFLNDVFEMLGLPDTDVGAVSGWSDEGVGIVDFGIKHLIDPISPDYQKFKNNPPDYILLNFNCDPEPLYGRVKARYKRGPAREQGYGQVEAQWAKDVKEYLAEMDDGVIIDE